MILLLISSMRPCYSIRYFAQPCRFQMTPERIHCVIVFKATYHTAGGAHMKQSECKHTPEKHCVKGRSSIKKITEENNRSIKKKAIIYATLL